MKLRVQNNGSSAGFSLIEILSVIVILSILMVFLVPNLIGQGDVVKAQTTSAFLQEISVALGEYNDEFGSYPSSDFKTKWGISPNPVNKGGEALVLQLWSTEWGGTGLTTELFDNSDGDSAKNNIVDPDVIANGALMELTDSFGNPIAYIHRKQYGEKFLYVTYDEDTGEPVESEVTAYKNSKTGTFFQPRKFQLVSAGIDCLFGTEDDITNFDRGE